MFIKVFGPFILALQVLGQVDLQKPFDVALVAPACPTGRPCTTDFDLEPTYKKKASTTVIWLTRTENRTLSEIATAITASVTTTSVSDVGKCISFNPIPVKPPVVTYYVETTTTDYSFTTSTTTSTTTLTVSVTPPANCVREIGRQPPRPKPSNGPGICRGPPSLGPRGEDEDAEDEDSGGDGPPPGGPEVEDE